MTEELVRDVSTKIHTIFGIDLIDIPTLNQFYAALNWEHASMGAMMPDGHLGYTMPIGGVIGTESYLVPSWVGYDIGCGVYGVKTTYRYEDVQDYAEEIFKNIKRSIPMGFNHHKKATEWHSYGVIPKTDWLDKMFKAKGGLKQLGTLGGGNHFIEIGVSDRDGFVWIVVHSGSRNVGHATATEYIKRAHPEGKCKEGSYGFDEKSQDGRDYFKDMNFCLKFALVNRARIAVEVDAAIKESVLNGRALMESVINCNHNLASWDNKLQLWIHRKGATVATKDTKGIIPGNMRDGSFVISGLGNPKSLFSCSHGAGRAYSRKRFEAKEGKWKDDELRSGRIAEFKKDMENIVSNREEGILDEAPAAYKSISKVMQAQEELVDIVEYITPIINIKA